MNTDFWRGKRVLLTGHTGFKGSWLSLWLQKLGAKVVGYALPPPSTENLFVLAAVGEHMESVYGDIRQLDRLSALVETFSPDIVFHLAAQPLVRHSFAHPVETYEVNVMGTVNVLEAVRRNLSCRVVVNITSDKCYENQEWFWGYRESDPLGGHDPYSSSKGCSELVTAAYRNSFFEIESTHPVAIASARAGNVIGGGDFSKDRLIPDVITAFNAREMLKIRNPDAIRPWQHVLEPLSGYLLLAEKLWGEPKRFAQSWNFGPAPDEMRTVRWIVERLREHWDTEVQWELDSGRNPHEAQFLMLDSSKARMLLGWKPAWTLEKSLTEVVRWHKARAHNEAVREIALRQISMYEGGAV